MREFRTALIYTTAYLPYIGGAELALKEITERWHNVRVLIVTARLSRTVPQRERIGRAEVIRIGIGIPRVDKLLLAVFGKRAGERALKGSEPDCVWAIMASYGALAALAYKRAHPRVSFILTLQEGDTHEHIARRARFLGKRFREIFERADAIQAISQYLADWARDMGATAPITVIPDGVDRNNLEVLTHTLNLSSRVHFAGAIAPEEIPLALAHADIFVRPSLSEGLGNSFLEAFAVGLPVIATPVGGIPDFLRDGETGWFAEVRNPESIAACVRYIIDPAHKEHVTHVTAAARALVEKEYSWESVMVRMGAIL